MKIFIVMVLAIGTGVSAYRHLEHVSQYDFKTVHELQPYHVAEKKLEDELEAKLEVLNKILQQHQQSKKNPSVTFKTEVQSDSGEEETKGEAKKGKQDSSSSYEFGYGVKDPKTGDYKDQWEKRVNGRVKGVYKFAESDGTERVVEYEADDKKGFEAKVKNVEKSSSEEEEGLKEKSKPERKVAHSYSYLKKYFV